MYLANDLRGRTPEIRTAVSLINNSTDWNIADQACLLAGITHIPLNENLTAEEIRSVIRDNSPELILYKKDRHRAMFRRSRDLEAITWLSIGDLQFSADPIAPLHPVEDDRHTAVILYTSGSANILKGARHTRQSLVSAIDTFAPVISALSVRKALSFLPLSFSGERKMNYTYQRLGMDICYPAHSKSILWNIQFFTPEIMALVPSMLESLLSDLRQSATACSLRYIVCGGAGIRAGIKEAYARMNIKVIEVYGLTETASIGTVNTEPLRKPGSAGWPLPGVDLRIGDRDELCIHCRSMLHSYVRQPLDLVEIDGRTYLRTGDKGYIDQEGWLFITGRLNNLIKLSNGTWLQPEEVESAFLQFAGDRIRDVIIGQQNGELTAMVFSVEDVGSIRQLLSEFNRNSIVQIDDVVLQSPEILTAGNTRLKISRNDIFKR